MESRVDTGTLNQKPRERFSSPATSKVEDGVAGSVAKAPILAARPKSSSGAKPSVAGTKILLPPYK